MMLGLVLGALLSATDPNAAWAKLSGLEGHWVAKTAKGKEVSLRFRFTSRQTVLIEDYLVGTTDTMTVFHRDGATIVATHYCAQGNQPRLSLDAEGSTASTLRFTFRDATNLSGPDASRLVTLVLEFVDASHLRMTETYEEAKKPDVTTLEFTKQK
ncbi:MAG: hypothetical protein QM817_11620 [Archangium sp.]